MLFFDWRTIDHFKNYIAENQFARTSRLRTKKITKTRKLLICLQKLINSNLKILKFEARFAYAVKFWTDFFD